jgi:hypothetical protein
LKYMCLIFMDNEKDAGAPHGKSHECETAQQDFDDTLRRRAQLIAADVLQPINTAMCVRNDQGHVTVAPVPAPQTMAPLHGVYVIDVRDLNEAIRVASHMPWARHGSIEVRTVRVTADNEFNEP